jgi:ABC-type multidrug transport system ATPase subunit
MVAVTHGYGGVPVLRGLELTVEPGAVAVLGPNGAGKSTLLRLATGLSAPQSGKVYLLGDDTKKGRDQALAHTAYLPENLYLDGYLTPREFLQFVADIRGVADGEARAVLLLEQLGGTPHADRLFKELSFGMQRKVGLAAAFMGGVPLMVLDEPDTGLDVTALSRLEGMIADTVAEGRTVLLSSHDMGFVERSCARVVVLGDGQVAWSGSSAELVAATGSTNLHDAAVAVMEGTAPGA